MSRSNRNSAIFYEQDGYTTGGGRLLGRQSAGESFLKGMARFSGEKTLYCYTDHAQKFRNFSEQVSPYQLPDASTKWINPLSANKVREPGCLFYSGPNISSFAWQRRHVGAKSYSLCGLTHTISSIGVMEAFGDLAIAPFEEWDAVICTSKSVRETVDHVLGNWAEYLEQRNGGKVSLPVQLPIIPLGINCEDFDPSLVDGAFEKSFREKHAIGADDVVILYVGRLASHAKAHPLPMYQALEKAAGKTQKKIHLVQAGWFASKSGDAQFKEGAAKYCPSVNAIFLDGREPAIRKNIWHVADIFTSLSDNIQETFGITPVEAMAAGLPVVATDWDGYRETIRDGVDGFLVRTTMPSPGMGGDLAYRYQVGVDSYDRFVGQTAMFTNVDTDMCADAYLKLIESPELRQKMGQEGARRARQVFDWKVLIPVYQDLWEGLAERRLAGSEARVAVAAPLIEDPFTLFAHYPTEVMDGNTCVSVSEGIA
ncbi:MAG: glycosyltransferase family 4 protein, partial [Sneathiella sp.]